MEVDFLLRVACEAAPILNRVIDTTVIKCCRPDSELLRRINLVSGGLRLVYKKGSADKCKAIHLHMIASGDANGNKLRYTSCMRTNSDSAVCRQGKR